MTHPGRRSAAAAALLVALGSGCAETVVDPTITPPDGGTADTVAAVPEGSPGELLVELLGELAGLSERVVDGDGDSASITRIRALWDAARVEVGAARPDLVASLDATIELANTAVERRRPADADKAYANMLRLVDDFVAD